LSTEAALALGILSYNLAQLFQRHLGWLDRVTAAPLRFRLFTTGGIINESGGVRTIRLACVTSKSGPRGDGSWRKSSARYPTAIQQPRALIPPAGRDWA
jgi:hypothetical protein